MIRCTHGRSLHAQILSQDRGCLENLAASSGKNERVGKSLERLSDAKKTGHHTSTSKEMSTYSSDLGIITTSQTKKQHKNKKVKGK